VTGAEFDAASWEQRYAAGLPTGRAGPGPALVAETADLPPGRALDAGCGVGGDALWLAARGWQVTAVDVSATALEAARRAAGAAGPEVAGRLAWRQADLTTWSPPHPFDLVTSHHVHVPGPVEDLVGRLASWVAPGGQLLVVGHDAGGHEHPAGAQVRLDQVVGALPAAVWEVLVAEPRVHELARPGGGGTVLLRDVVVRARKRLVQPPAPGGRTGGPGEPG
jgi:SAM-dependent methyltransferase